MEIADYEWVSKCNWHISGNYAVRCMGNRRHIRRTATSQYIGVGYRKSDRKYYARFRHRGERFWLGFFDEEIETARAYDRTAVEHRGEFARLNLPEEWPPKRLAKVYAEYLRTGQSAFARASLPTPRQRKAKMSKRTTRR